MANFRLPPPYTIIRHLGKGGIGEIYLAYHENLQKQVIVKKVKDHCVDIMDSRIEVDILKNLHHRYLPQVYDFIQINGGIYTVMDYIPGHDLLYPAGEGAGYAGGITSAACDGLTAALSLMARFAPPQEKELG